MIFFSLELFPFPILFLGRKPRDKRQAPFSVVGSRVVVVAVEPRYRCVALLVLGFVQKVCDGGSMEVFAKLGVATSRARSDPAWHHSHAGRTAKLVQA